MMSNQMFKINNDIALELYSLTNDSSLKGYGIKRLIKTGENLQSGIIEIPSAVLLVPGDSPAFIREIASDALNGIKCDELILPESLTKMCSLSFSGVQVGKLTFNGEVKVIPPECFKNSVIGEIIFKYPKKVAIVAYHAFSDIKGMKTFNWPSRCTHVPAYCFESSQIAQIYGLENVTEVSTGAFSEIKGLKTLKWPENCTTIPCRCFAGSSIESITGIENVVAIDISAFAYTPNLKEFNWPKDRNIPECCFYGSGINCIHHTNEILSVGDSAFAETSLSTISLPNVIRFGRRCFGNSVVESFSIGGNNSDMLFLYSNTFPDKTVDLRAYSHINILIVNSNDDYSNLKFGFDSIVELCNDIK